MHCLQKIYSLREVEFTRGSECDVREPKIIRSVNLKLGHSKLLYFDSLIWILFNSSLDQSC
jgi:hypothetical protein